MGMVEVTVGGIAIIITLIGDFMGGGLLCITTIRGRS
jgi:hypothetical protein